MYEKKIAARYVIEMLGILFFYTLVLVVSIEVGKSMPKGLGQTLIVLSPTIPFLIMLIVVARHLWRIDEYLRLQMLENLAITTGVTACWTFAYGFLEGVGYPKLSMFTIWPVMCGTFIVMAFGRILALLARR
jgi:hypothetical protein